MLVNPFTDDAVVDMSFATDSGAARPTPLQGFVVPKGTVRTIDVGSFVRRRSMISAMVNARTGRVVAEGVLRFDGSGDTLGASIIQAAPAAGSAWYFPSGRSSSTLTERYSVFNPGTRDTVVELTIVVSGQDGEPFEIDVPAGQVVEFVPADETRVPKGVDYSLVAVSPRTVASLWRDGSKRIRECARAWRRCSAGGSWPTAGR